MMTCTSRSIPFEAWPIRHQTRWCRAFSKHSHDDEFAFEDEDICQWAETTRKSVIKAYGMFLYSMRKAGRSDAITADNVRHYVAECRERNLKISTITLRLGKLNSAMMILEPDMNRRWLQMSYANLKQRCVKEGKKKHGRLVDPGELLILGKELVDQARQRPLSIKSAITHRNGTMLCLLSVAPIRLRAFASTVIGRDIDIEKGSLKYGPDKTKEKRNDDRELPNHISTILTEHAAHFRPLLLQNGVHNHLWVGRLGAALSPGAISRLIGDITLKHLGRRVSPHMFRDATATFVKEHHPEENAVAIALLNHRSEDTTRTYQEETRKVTAQKLAQTIISEERMKQRIYRSGKRA